MDNKIKELLSLRYIIHDSSNLHEFAKVLIKMNALLRKDFSSFQ